MIKQKLKTKKTIAISEIFLMILSSIAFSFIIGGMGIMSLSEMSAAYDGETKQVGGTTYYYRGNSANGPIGWYPQGGGLVYPDTPAVSDQALLNQLNGGSATAAAVPAAGTTPPPSGAINPGARAPMSDEDLAAEFNPDLSNTFMDSSVRENSNTGAGVSPPGNNVPSTEGWSKEGGYSSPFSKKEVKSPVGGNFVEGIVWAGVVLGLTETVAGFASNDNDKNMIRAVGRALAAGIVAGKTMASLLSMGGGKGNMDGSVAQRIANGLNSHGTSGVTAQGVRTWVSGITFVAAAYFTFAAQYKKVSSKTETIEFLCLDWQAPRGGADCNKCNDKPLQPCSEYRCRSLGQTCKLINAGTGFDRCINSAPSDTTSPGIKPWPQKLTQGYSYSNVKERPAGDSAGISGMSITYNGGCLPAFTPFEFGIITTDIGGVTQPGQCKIDYNHTTNFNEMQFYFGESNIYAEEHSQAMSLPGTDLVATLYGSEENDSTLPIKNDGEYKLYVRCKDGNGNENRDEFVINFCVDKSPDLMAPIIKAANPPANSPILYQVDNATIQVYTNEPSECRWARKDASYGNMVNQMQCNNEIWELNAEFLYTCNADLTGIKDKQDNNFYFRCTDRSAQNNTMQESYEYTLIGTQPLDIIKVGPNGTISGSTNTVTTTLTVQTDNGFRNGEAKCSYSTSADSGFIEMVNTGTNMHSQPLDLTGGAHTYYYSCIDAGGNMVSNVTNFTVYVDKYAPVVTRVYNFESKLTINTDEESSCKYSTTSCNFDVSKEGILMPYDKNKVHYAEWKTTQSYYIKCMDEDGNQPDPTVCSIVVRPYRTSQE